MIWYIWWLAAFSFVAILAVAIGHTFNYDRDFYIPADEVTRTEERRTRVLAAGAMEPADMTRVPEAADGELHFYVTDEHGHAEGGTMLGFWIYLMSDCLIFAVLFAVYAVLGRSYAAGPGPPRCSTCRWWRSTPPCCCCPPSPTASPCSRWRRNARRLLLAWMAVTGLFGAAFVGLELNEFAHLIAEGAGPTRSAFLSAFFTLVGTHGLHVTMGLIWLVTLMVQVAAARPRSREPAPADVLSACSGTSWTSSGSASSPSSTS